MGRKRDEALKRLVEVRDEQALVRIDRGGELDLLEGYVVAIGTEWLLLALLDPAIVLDGHAALRLTDLRRVRRRQSGEMAQQALTLRGQWPPTPPEPGLDLESTEGLLTSLMTQPVLTIHPEHDNPDICFVGAPVAQDDQTLRLVEVTPRGVWNSRPTKYRVEGITRIDVGGRYEQALLSVAGPLPPQD